MQAFKFKTIMSSFAVVSCLIASIGSVEACTSLVTTDKSGNAYHGRTMEFAGRVPSSLSYIPEGSRVDSVTAENKRGFSFSTQYAILGMTAPLVAGASQPFMIDGMNDQGLSLAANAYVHSSSPYANVGDSRMLSGNDFGTWVLGSFQTVEQVKQALKKGEVQFWLPQMPFLGNLVAPMHYAIHDKKGNGIVVEFEGGQIKVYDNPVNVLTNGPSFPWQLENLNNYTFNNVNQNIGELGKLKLETADSGIALSALPSAQTSQGRFVKAAFYANYVTKGKTPDEAINQLAHIMNNFDRPDGLTVDLGGGIGDGPRSNRASSEVTSYTVMKDLSRGQYYVRSINAMNWSVVDMMKIQNLKQTKSVSSYDIDKDGADVYSLFQKR